MRRPNRSTAAAPSVWETRMKMDQVRGGIKVFNGGAKEEEEERIEVGSRVRLSRVKSSPGPTPERRKRKNWKPLENNKDPIQLRKALSELSVVAGDQTEKTEEEEEDKEFDDKEVDLPSEKMEIVEEDKKVDQIWDLPVSIDLEKSPPSDVECEPIELEDEFHESGSVAYSDRIHSVVDLVMWRDISRSAFVFGVGTFLLISSSYTKDLNFSLISAMAYMGLLHLAAIFIYKSFICRGTVELDYGNQGLLIGEDELNWLIKLVLPCANEILIHLRALFSGDPATTMKLGVLLFVLARCGGQITIWNLVRIAFFGAFTIPKFCSSYSSQLSRYGNFWVERWKDGWESCTHKKAAAAIIFLLLWNLSSTVARIWSLFMLIVAVKYYQHCMQGAAEWDNCNPEEAVGVEKRHGPVEEVVRKREHVVGTLKEGQTHVKGKKDA